MAAPAEPESVYAIGARMTNEVPPEMYNYGQMQIRFNDGSLGWYEAGWGPMMSQTAFFIKDVIGPEGSVSISAFADSASDSSDVNSHTRTDALHLHSGELGPDGEFVKTDRMVRVEAEPDHDELCALEQRYFLDAIRKNTCLAEHWRSAISSLRIVLAADESVRTGKVIQL